MKSILIPLLSDLASIYSKKLRDEKDNSSLTEIRSLLKKNYSEFEKIVIVKLDAIGDWIMFYNTYLDLKALFPNAKITLIVYEDLKEALTNYNNIDDYLLVNRELFIKDKDYRERLLAFVQGTNYDLLINPLYSREFNADLLCAFTNAQLKLGVNGDNSNISKQLTLITDTWYDFLLPSENSVVKFELDRNREIVELLGGNTQVSTLPLIPVTENEESNVNIYLKANNIDKYAVVFPGSRGGEKSIKFWSRENWAKVIDFLHNSGMDVVVLGGKGEEQICFSIASMTEKNPFVVTGHFNIWQSAALIKKASLFVGNDTSMGHVAAALSIPSVILLGGGHFGRFFPYPENHSSVSVFKKMDCYNCNWQCTKETNECIKKILPQDVIEQCMKLMNNFRITETIENVDKRKKYPGLNIIHSQGSTAKVDLIFPPGNHSWHLREGIISYFRRNKMLNRVFLADQSDHRNIFEYLAGQPSSDMLMALGGDHHLWYLHDSENKRKIFNLYDRPKVCYSYESTRSSIYPQYAQRAESSYKVFSHFLYSDEGDIVLFEKNKLSAMYFPQFADHRIFSDQTVFNQRKKKAFFCGKLWTEYSERRKLIDVLKDAGLCDTYSNISTMDLVKLYNTYAIAINPIGVLGGFNVRTFEALSAGTLLFQYKHTNRPINNSLFDDGKHLLYYDENDHGMIVKQLENIATNIGDYYKVAQEGHREFLAKHTIDIRMNQMLDWIFNNSQSDSKGNECGTAQNAGNSYSFYETALQEKILLSAVISTYNAEKYLKGCIEDLINQTLYKKGLMEVIVVNSGSQQNEEKIVREFQAKYSHIRYICTPERETIYKAWNRGVKASSGKYITNANTDDRHKSDALEKMVKYLEKNDDTDVVYANDLQTETENDIYDSATQKSSLRWSDYDKDLLLFGCFIGPHPVWRKSLHNRIGFFDESLKVVGDYEFWLRASAEGKFHHLEEDLGLYLYSASSAEHIDQTITNNENQIVQRKYLIKYLAAESDINRVAMKLEFLGQRIKNNRYFELSQHLLTKRRQGIELENAISKYLSLDENILIDKSLPEKLNNLVKIIENEQPILDCNLQLGIINSILGIYYLNGQNKELARQYFNDSLQNDPENDTASLGLSKLLGAGSELFVMNLLDIADELLSSENLEKAEQIIIKVLEYDKNNLDALNNLAAICIMQNKKENALELLEKVFVLDAGNEIASNNLKYLKTMQL